MKVLQNKPQIRNMNNIFCDLYYTVFKNRDEKEIVNDKYENVYVNFNDFISPNPYNGSKLRETMLK